MKNNFNKCSISRPWGISLCVNKGDRLQSCLSRCVPDCRFETLEPEMNNLGLRVTDVNQVNQQLLGSENRDKEQINRTQEQLNDRSGLPGNDPVLLSSFDSWKHHASAPIRSLWVVSFRPWDTLPRIKFWPFMPTQRCLFFIQKPCIFIDAPPSGWIRQSRSSKSSKLRVWKKSTFDWDVIQTHAVLTCP